MRVCVHVCMCVCVCVCVFVRACACDLKARVDEVVETQGDDARNQVPEKNIPWLHAGDGRRSVGLCVCVRALCACVCGKGVRVQRGV